MDDGILTNAKKLVIKNNFVNYVKKHMRKPLPHQFKKGNPGRPKGTPNKFTTLREAFLGAFQESGGQKALTLFAKGKNKKHFYHMIASMLPKDIQVSGPGGQPLVPPTIIYQGVPAPSTGVKPAEPSDPATSNGS